MGVTGVAVGAGLALVLEALVAGVGSFDAASNFVLDTAGNVSSFLSSAHETIQRVIHFHT